MKKIICLALVFVMLFSFAAFANDKITVILDGEQLVFDSEPEITNDRTMVPMRVIFEKMGASVNWVPELQSIEVICGGTIMVLFVGKDSAIVNDKMFFLDSPPYIKNDRTLVPLRFISESVGAKVDWEGDTQTVTIVSAPLKSRFVPFGEYFSIPSPSGFTDEPVASFNKRDGRNIYTYNITKAGYDNFLRYEKYLEEFKFTLTTDKENGDKYFYNGSIVLKIYSKKVNNELLYHIELYSDISGNTLPR